LIDRDSFVLSGPRPDGNGIDGTRPAWSNRQLSRLLENDNSAMNEQRDRRSFPDEKSGTDRDPAERSSRPGSSVTGPTLKVRETLLKTTLDDPALTALLCSDQAERWGANQRVPAEAYLALYPAIRDKDEVVFELIYNEYVIRESLGDTPSAEEFFWRFPQFSNRLRRQLELHEALGPEDLEDIKGSVCPPAAGAGALEQTAASGLVLPGYQILGELGRGGAGVVYKARQEGLNRLVALKVIQTGVYGDPAVATRFRAEAEAAARFQHPNLIHIYEVGEHAGLAYIALEYAAGGNLQQKLAGTPQEPMAASRLVEALARAVQYAHERGIIHRDLKPANVVLTEHGVPKLTDFGLAKLLERDEGPTLTGDILGTPSYMSPEQARGASADIQPATDVYALGAILYEMLSGQPPFKGATPLATMEQVLCQEPLPPSKLQRSTPRDLETICLKCLEKEPRRRYLSASDLAEDLRRFVNGETITARPASALEKAWKWGRRRPSTATAVATASSAVALLIAGALYSGARLRDSNSRLIRAAGAAQKAERAADASARTALEQRNLALKALNELVFGVQDRLGDSPQTRPLRRNLLGTATAGLDEIARSAEAAAPDLSRAVAHQKLGDIFRQIGRSDEARRQLELARGLSEGLARAAPGDLAVADCLSKACTGLGELSLGADQLDEARTYFERVVVLNEAIAKAHPNREEARLGLIEAYFLLGRSFGFSGELSTAEAWFRKTRDLCAKWVALDPANTRFKDVLASCHRKLADMKKLAKEYAAAKDEYLEAIALGREVVAAEPGNLLYETHLSLALQDLASVTQLRHERAEARPLLEEAERLFTEVEAADPEDQLVQLHLVRALCDLARLERDEMQYTKAAELFRRALRRLSRLEREGRLEGRPGFRYEQIPALRQEIANCEGAPVALGALDAIVAQPSRVACQLLLLRARLLTAQGRQLDVLAAAEALCGVDADTVEDLYALARSLAASISCLDDVRWPGPPAPAHQLLRQRCADRAVAALTRVSALDLEALRSMAAEPDLAPIRQHPGYRQLIERLGRAR
jgi:tetratricopeptide (TPR) repeat protein